MVENGVGKVSESQEPRSFVGHGEDLGLYPERSGEPLRV